jgi:hypothetical protein
LGGDNAEALHLQDLLQAAPKAPTPQQAAAPVRLRGLLKFNEEALAAANLADQH